MNVTFIIPNRGGKNIGFVIDNFKSTFGQYFNSIYFIIVEQADNLPFKRGQLYNIGVKYCKTEWIGLIDNDIVNINSFDPIQTYKEFNNTPFVAFDKIVQCEIHNGKIEEIEEPKLRPYGFGAFNFMKKDDFVKCNGFSNLCIGWGKEDNILNEKIHFARYIHNLGHITHPVRKNNEPDLLKFNRRILKKYQEGRIDPEDDGLKQTTYGVIKIDDNWDTKKISVNNIGVCGNYKYEELFKHAKEIEQQYIK